MFGKTKHVEVTIIGFEKVISLLIETSNLFLILNTKLDKIMATQKEDAAILADVLAKLQKANAEIQKKIQDLIDAAANADVQPELQSAIDALTPAAQALDDIVPDTI